MEMLRWRQRLESYLRALERLQDDVNQAKQRELSKMEQQGLIKSFEFTHELAWRVMKDYLTYQGTTNISGSRDAMREAFQAGLIKDGQTWMTTIASRNRTAHTYDQAVMTDISKLIVNEYLPLFENFAETMKKRV
ncbi:MAG: nucleotidyltransferase substrate binding protein [Deinococcota bacterium]